MSFLLFWRRKKRILAVSSVLLALLYVFLNKTPVKDFLNQEQLKIKTEVRWLDLEHQKHRNEPVIKMEALKVVEAGTNVKVPGLEIYVVSAIFHPQHRPASHSNSKKEEGTKTAEQHAGKEPGDDKADATVTSKVYLTTWTDTQTEKIDVKFCCVFVSSQKPHDKIFGEANRTAYYKVMGKPSKIKMSYAEYECNVSSSQPVDSLAFAHQNCSGQISPFLAIEHPDDPNDVNDLDEQRVRNQSTDIGKEATVALCLPALYGQLPIQPLVEWVELQRLLGVSRVHIHYTELHNESLSVLKLYQQQGFVTLRPFVPAIKTGEPHRGLLRNKTRSDYQAWIDAWVLLNDCKRRLYTYSIIMVLDVDEILIPQPPLSLPEVFQKALAQHPDVSYFMSHAFIHLYDWGISYPNTSMSFLQYLNRTSSNLLDSKGHGKSSPKTFFVPSRVGICTRLIHWPIKGFKRVLLPTSMASLHHYRSCKQKLWAEQCFTWTRVPDSRLLTLQFCWESAVKRGLNLLNG